MRKVAIEVGENNTPLIALEFTQPDPNFVGPVEDAPEIVFDLTGWTIEFFVKPNADVEDDDVAVIFYSSSGGGGIEVTDENEGKAELQVTQPATDAKGVRFYHVDLVSDPERVTYQYGPWKVRNL